MFDITPLFIYKFVFVTELIVAEALFCYKLRRRGRFALRLAGGLAISYLGALLFPAVIFNAAYVSLMFVTLFGCTVAALGLCFKESWRAVLFCAIAAYTTQHIACVFYDLLTAAVLSDVSVGAYGATMDTEFTLWHLLLYVVAYFPTYYAAYFLFARGLKKRENFAIGNLLILLFTGVVLVADVVFGLIVKYYWPADGGTTFLVVFYLCNALCCVLALVMQFGLLDRKNLRSERDVLTALLDSERERFERSKRNYEFLSVKCHDLRHWINAARKGDFDKAALGEMERAVAQYDSVLRTGNTALDVILSEMCERADASGVTFTCVADGGALAFMSDADIYSLVGNAVENALEYVARLDARDKRFVRLSLRRSGAFVSLVVENYFEGDLRLRGGLPETTKRGELHGYGMKSMLMITEKYGGTMSVAAEDGTFAVSVLFPSGGQDGR